MVRHTDTPQGLAYRDGSGLACVLADFGSAKMLHPLMLNAAATEHEPISKMWWPTLRPALWLSRGFYQLPGVRPASTISRLGRALAGQIQALRLTYRHESTATAACAAPSIPYVCTRPYRAPELFYGAECYRGEPDGTRAYARVREYLLPPIRPSIRPCILLFVRACVRVDVRARSVHHSKPTAPPPPPSRSVVPRLLALRRPAARQLANRKGRPLSWRRLGGATASDSCVGRASYSAHSNGAMERPHTASRLAAMYFSSHRCGEQLFDAESVDGHQVHMSNAQARARTYTWTTRLIRPPGATPGGEGRQERRTAPPAA